MLIKVTFTLQQKSSDSKIIGIHTKNVFGLVCHLHRKNHLGKLHARVSVNSAFLSKNGRKSSQMLLKVTQDSRKISFHSLLMTVPDKKNCPTSGYFCCYTQKRGKISPES